MDAHHSTIDDGLPSDTQRLQMQLNPVTLRFSGTCAGLETAFRKHYLERSLPPMRMALFLAAVLYALFGVLDALLFPDVRHFAWLIRFGIVCPATLLLLLSTWSARGQRLIQPLLALLIVIAGAGIIAIILVAPPPANQTYYAGLILLFMLGYTFVRAQFVWASLSAWIVVLLYEVSDIGFGVAPLSMMISNNFFFISANIVGMMACYAIERAARRDFFLGEQLALEQENVRAANRELEERVNDRTADLARSNRELAVEIQERRRAEAERIRLAEQLKQSEKLEVVGKMAAGMAHDLNNILSVLVGYPDLLLTEIPADSPMREDLLTIKRSGEKAAAMVQDLLTMARRGVANAKVFNANALIGDYLTSPEFRSLQQQHPHVRFRTVLDETLMNVCASPVHIAKSLMNLVANAAEAQLTPGQVSIETRNFTVDRPLSAYESIDAGDYVIIRVSDTGVGIAAAELKRIFEPFFTKKRTGRSGTGLGMSVVWSTVKDAGGFIDVESREGQGTTFSLYLPITRKTAATADDRMTIDDYRGSERVLVVDDLADQRKLATAMLSKLGYAVNAVSSGEAALEFLAHNTVDILVLDMIMDPGIDGCETYRRIVERSPGQKAIIASGYAESERVREAQRLGAGVYVRKPYTMENIALAVRGELDRRVGSVSEGN